MYSTNNSGKQNTPARSREIKRKKSLLIALLVNVCLFVSGLTMAFLYTNTEPVKNTFKAANVSSEVLEGADGHTFDGETKKDVRIRNTGNTDAYIRAMVVITWMSEDGTKVNAVKPIDDVDYQIIYADETNIGTKWVKSSDGFWYYTKPVPVGESTEDLIESCLCIVTPPEEYYLSVEIIASAIQSTPVSVVTTQWDSGVSGINNDGKTLEIKINTTEQGG